MFYVASRVFDPTTKRLFEFEYHDSAIPTVVLLLEFVQIRTHVLQNSSGSQQLSQKQKFFSRKSQASLTTTQTEKISCIICNNAYLLFQCPKFTQNNVKLRFKFAKANRLCINCLSNQHKTSECKLTYTCRQCSSKHHTLLHFDDIKSDASSKSTSEQTKSNDLSQTSSAVDNPTFVGAPCSTVNVVLGTAIIRIRYHSGNWEAVRVLIDTGSQVSVITNACVSKLGLKRRKCNTSVTGFSQTSVFKTKSSVSCVIVPQGYFNPKITCEPIILSKITGHMPTTRLSSNTRSNYGNINFADPNFDTPGPIEFLIGADIYPQILGHSSKVLHVPGLPSANETALGWVIIGQALVQPSTPQVSLLLTSEQSVEHLLRQFWEIEEPITLNKLFTDTQKAEDHFKRTSRRDSFGQYSLSLPFCSPPSVLGTSRDMAVSRFYNLERKLSKDQILYDQYRAFMKEYENLGHMKIASRPGKYHIPHHAVVKYDGDKLKLRVVFDASAKSKIGKSLNELLHVGPKLQTDISDLLFRCGTKRYIFTADICKMYRQIKINENNCVYQNIVWRYS